ncbi:MULTISPECIES: VOC family protein [unclassified Streptomyces]|uniref:VOC family protein n=1 Tax=unclassified Streptomyces TaxID=2593676 RepID=UPI003252078A
MAFTHVLAVAPVTDIETSAAWYERLLGRPADTRPMETLADWHITGSGWIQVFVSPEHAGKALLNLAVDDLDTVLAELAGRGLTAGGVQPGGERARFAALHDPDGNRVTLIENPVA